MKNLLLFSFLIFACYSCQEDDFDTTTLTLIDEEPVIVDIDNPISFRTSKSSDELVEGRAYYSENTTNGSTLYLIASDAVDVECPGGLAASYNGDGVFFHFLFLDTGESEIILGARFSANLDGTTVGAMNNVIPACETEPITIDYEIVDGRMIGKFTGEFVYFNPVYTEPFENCDNFLSAGILEASFDLPIINCN